MILDDRMDNGDLIILDGATGSEIRNFGAVLSPVVWCGAANLQYPDADLFQCLEESVPGLAESFADGSLPITDVLSDYQRESFLDGDFGFGLVPDFDMLMTVLNGLESERCSPNPAGTPEEYANEIFPDHEALRAGVLGVARLIAEKSPLAIWGTKEMINYARDHSTEDSLNYIATWQTGMFQPQDMAETFKAKVEKRDPEFDDLLPMRKPI